MKLNPEEISLCKQVAERYRKEIKKGNWVIEENRANIPLLVIDTIGNDLILSLGNIAHSDTHSKNCIPLWTISDCLEFLREKGFMVRLIEYENHSGIKRIECNCYGHKTKGAFSERGNKDEEACLKAVLTVLEEE